MSKIFVSAFRQDLSRAENEHRHGQMKLLLDISGIKHTEATGKYNGVVEPSVIFNWSSKNERAAQKLSSEFNQDCYLVTDANRYGYLVNKNGQFIDMLGKYQVGDDRPSGADYTEVNGKFLYFK